MSRLLIFNLPREADPEAVRALVAGWRMPGHGAAGAVQATIALHTIPGADSELFAVVQLAEDRGHAWALARHLNGCRHVGSLRAPRPLWSWLPAMAWA